MALALPAITALARAGAIERAWAAFVEGGYHTRSDDPAALAVRGRLLKSRALRETGAARHRDLTAAASAYASAHALAPAPYLAINVATLKLLAGDAAAAREAARDVLALLDAPTPPADTPYYLAATRAEALLLLDDPAGAREAMAKAATANPDGWHDRAVTISQLRTISAAQGSDPAWVADFAPPASLHFAGHIGIAARGASERRLVKDVDALLARHPIGFAWGALAAGADIIIAERLVVKGCELHVVLPCPSDLFEAQSVAPAGTEWVRRYRALLDVSQSMRVAGTVATSVHDPLATRHAGELAIGGALLNARILGAEAMQLVVTDEAGGGANTSAQARLWPLGAGRQIRASVPRDRAIDALFPDERPDPARELVAHVAIALDRPGLDVAACSSRIEAVCAPVSEALAQLPQGAVRAAPWRWDLALTDLGLALAAIVEVQHRCGEAGTPPTAIGAHFGMAHLLTEPASGSAVPYGPGVALAAQLQAMAPAGTILVSDALAVTLLARGMEETRLELYHPGEGGTGGAVYMLLIDPARPSA